MNKPQKYLAALIVAGIILFTIISLNNISSPQPLIVTGSITGTVDFTILPAPSINLISPPNGTRDVDGYVVFTYGFNDTTPMQNCTLYLDGTANQTSSSINVSTNNYFSILGMSEAIYNWYVQCLDINGSTGISDTWALNVSFDPIANTSSLFYSPNVNATLRGFNLTENGTTEIYILNSTGSFVLNRTNVSVSQLSNFSFIWNTNNYSVDNYTFFIKDQNNSGIFANQTFVILPPYNWTGIIYDTNITPYPSTVEVFDLNGNLIDSDDEIYQLFFNYGETYRVVVTPENISLRRIVAEVIFNYGPAGNMFGVDDPPETVSTTNLDFVDIVAYEPNITYSTANITLNHTAADNFAVYKCLNWTFTGRRCTNENWTKISDVTDGATSTTVTLAFGDPGLAIVREAAVTPTPAPTPSRAKGTSAPLFTAAIVAEAPFYYIGDLDLKPRYEWEPYFDEFWFYTYKKTDYNIELLSIDPDKAVTLKHMELGTEFVLGEDETIQIDTNSDGQKDVYIHVIDVGSADERPLLEIYVLIPSPLLKITHFSNFILFALLIAVLSAASVFLFTLSEDGLIRMCGRCGSISIKELVKRDHKTHEQEPDIKMKFKKHKCMNCNYKGKFFPVVPKRIQPKLEKEVKVFKRLKRIKHLKIETKEDIDLCGRCGSTLVLDIPNFLRKRLKHCQTCDHKGKFFFEVSYNDAVKLQKEIKRMRSDKNYYKP